MSKRQSMFDQGEKDNPYIDRDEGAVDTPKKATAAQMATRKIKSVKPRRTQPASSVSAPNDEKPDPPDTSSGLTSTPNFGAPSTFNFGSGTMANPNPFGGFGALAQPESQSAINGGIVGNGASSSFPPPESSTAGNAFANSSFPTFGSTQQNTGFNPQPPSSGFNFTTGTSSPFGTSVTNGIGSSGFQGSIFNIPPAQPQLADTTSGDAAQSTTATAASSLFSASAAPQSNIFGNVSSNASSAVAKTTAPSSNPFASLSSAATTSAPTASIFNFGSTAPAQPETPAPKLDFGSGAISLAPTTNVSSTSTDPPMVSSFGSSSIFQNSFGQAPQPLSAFKDVTQTNHTGFSFLGASTQGATPNTPAPFTSLSQGFGTSTQGPVANTPAPADNILQGFSSTSQPDTSSQPATTSTPFPGFGAQKGAQIEAPTVSTSDPPPNIFKFNKPEEVPTATDSRDSVAPATPRNAFASGFGSNAQTDTNKRSSESAPQPAETPAKTSLFNFGATRPFNFGATEPAAKKPEVTGTSQSSKPALSSQNPFSFLPTADKQPQAAKSTSLGIFSSQPQGDGSKTVPVGNVLDSSQAQKPFNPFTPSTDKSGPSTEQKDPAPGKDSQQTAAPSLLERLPSTSKNPAPLSPASSMPTLTEAAAPPSDAVQTSKIPKIGKYHVPSSWKVPEAADASLLALGMQISKLNEKYREKINEVTAAADWSALSYWHYKESSKIVANIAAVKKHLAAEKGITGNESSLSTKRKAAEEVHRENEGASPSKKARASDPASTPTPKSSTPLSTTPKSAPPATQTSSLFGNILGKSTASAATPSIFGSTSSSKEAAEPKSTTSPGGFTFGANKATDSSKKSTASSPFQFTASSTSGIASEPKSSENKLPSFGSGVGGGGSGSSLFSQFAKTAKTREQLAAERKEKAKAADYDSDEETEEQWSARYDREEAARLAEEEKKRQETPAFTFAASTKKASDSAPAASSSKSGFSQPTSGTSTPGLFSSRLGSPAPSASKSVFDTPAAGQTPSSNIFGHLSSAASSNNQDDDEDDDEEEQLEAQSHIAQSSDNKRKLAESESESDESLEETMRRKKQQTAKPSLLSRMTKADDSEVEKDEAEKENDSTSAGKLTFGQSNGMQTPNNRPFQFFDFENAGARTAPSKSDFFAGDQTFKAGSPIVFGTQKKGAPALQLQPATPSPAEFSATPQKPSGSSLFNLSSGNTPSWLAPTAGQPSAASIASSVLSSRAPTPLSEAETSGKDSAAENEDDEGVKQEQLDLSQLTEDENAENDILFHTEQAIAKQQSEKDGQKVWENFARGRLWILRNKESGKAFVRIRLASGKTPLNYNILPRLKTNVTGNSKKMVSAVRPAEGGKLRNIFFALKSSEVAQEFSSVYNENVPST